jgi:hypothetical protein
VLAAKSTGNHIFLRRTENAEEALRQGATLTEAVARLDDTGEFKWRLENAAHAGTGFERALSGWHDSLEAKAFQQEQAAAQVVATLLVILNGLLVALVAIGFFQWLVTVTENAMLW